MKDENFFDAPTSSNCSENDFVESVLLLQTDPNACATTHPSATTHQDNTQVSFFFGICPPLGLLFVLGPCERYMTPTLDAALLICSRAGTDPDLSSGIVNPRRDPTFCIGNSNIIFLLLNDPYTILRRDSNPPKQSEDWYQSMPLPPSHHGWVHRSVI